MSEIVTLPAPAVSPTQSTPARQWPSVLVLIALGFLLVVIVMALFAPLIAPYDPNLQNIPNKLKGPSSKHWLGTDALGRDQWSRLIFGSRIALIAVAISLAVALALGVPAGVAAGYRGGIVDAILSRLFDGLMSVPPIIFAMTFIAAAGAGLTNAMIAVGIIFSPLFFRLSRASTQGVREETFIEASRSIGCRRARILRKHVLPNVLPPLLVQVATGASRAVAAEASLSFLGFGVKPPTASWGAMLTDGTRNMLMARHLLYAPGIAIALTVLALSIVGGWLNGIILGTGTRRS